ncbi:hypothetical protein HDU67_001310 [Dinochytrium kinnereticum]|nr:hypothetical protein HDU67_001310 [Dinochytrium kinnereticum]
MHKQDVAETSLATATAMEATEGDALAAAPAAEKFGGEPTLPNCQTPAVAHRPPPLAAADSTAVDSNEAVEDTPDQPPTILEEVWLSIFTPGINGRVEFFMDMCFYALFVSLLALMVGTRLNPHVVFLFGISVCLFVSVKWFLLELAKVKQAEKDAKEKETVTEETKKDQ